MNALDAWRELSREAAGVRGSYNVDVSIGTPWTSVATSVSRRAWAGPKSERICEWQKSVIGSRRSGCIKNGFIILSLVPLLFCLLTLSTVSLAVTFSAGTCVVNIPLDDRCDRHRCHMRPGRDPCQRSHVRRHACPYRGRHRAHDRRRVFRVRFPRARVSRPASFHLNVERHPGRRGSLRIRRKRNQGASSPPKRIWRTWWDVKELERQTLSRMNSRSSVTIAIFLLI